MRIVLRGRVHPEVECEEDEGQSREEVIIGDNCSDDIDFGT